MSRIDICEHTLSSYPDGLSCEALADAIKANLQSSDVLSISVNIRFANTYRYEQGGITLLTWLRLKGVRNHCVLYSFETLFALLQRAPEHLIAASKGVSYIQLPDILDERVTPDLAEDQSIDENVKLFLKPAFDVQRFRHTYANVWGLQRLLQAHNRISPQDKITTTTLTVPGLNYHIAEFLNRPAAKAIDPYLLKEANKVLSDLKQKKGPRILYIDDQADKGWHSFLELLFHSSVKLLVFPLNTNRLPVLLLNLKMLISQERIDLIISDLRLFPEEENKPDYEDFTSIKLMKAIKDARKGGKRQFPNLSYMLFTASNKLIFYKTMIKGGKFAPQGLFIKEGFDLQYDEEQSFHNYLHLIKTLNSFFAIYKRKAGERVELFNEEETRKVFELEDSLNDPLEITIRNEIALRMRPYSHIVLDSNIYIGHHRVALAAAGSLMIYPVYKELKRNAGDEYASVKSFLSNYFIKRSRAVTFGLSDKDIAEIDQRFRSGEKLEDLADDYFVPTLNYLRHIEGSNILFISDDHTDKGTKMAPFNQVRQWIAEQEIKNVAAFRPRHFLDESTNRC